MNINLTSTDSFSSRHIGPRGEEIKSMLKEINASSIDQLIDETIPASIRLKNELALPEALSEYQYIRQLKQTAAKNKLFKSYIGLGYYDCITPAVIQRNIFENPGWYTQYTPYQAEIAQGRLEALLNYQTMVADLTKLEIANASLLDEATAAAEAMIMFYNYKNKREIVSTKFFVSEKCFPQTIDVLKTRSKPLGIELVIGNHEQVSLDGSFFGALVQYPDTDGNISDYKPFIEKAHKAEVYIAMAADILSLALLTPPGELGADVAVGSTQRFGVPIGYGGPHAAYFATKEEFTRNIPGRIIGVSLDADGNRALRMALQTREQHIKREKATSNICTAQALLAIMAGMYTVYHGSEGIKAIAQRVHALTVILSEALKSLSIEQINASYFDTLKIKTGKKTETIKKIAESKKVNFNYIDKENISIALDEATLPEDVQVVVEIFAEACAKKTTVDFNKIPSATIASSLQRKSTYLSHPVFNSYHSESEMMRYIKSLENKDLSLVHSMISLGSCTMKLNASTELMPVSWPEFGKIHPFVPAEQAQGYAQIFTELESYLSAITGFHATSLQPNSGAQGEYAGLMVIAAYQADKGEQHRNIALIPSSAHGTNPASAVMAGMQVIIVKCDEKGNIDIADLKSKAEQHKDKLSCLMVTYPSTHGVFEEGIKEICAIIHQNGGQVYMDGANMNAQVGLTCPANIGADVCHLNLHKTFSIPHGGGGPGIGSISVIKHLAPYLPGNPVIKTGGEKSITAVSAAPWGSASILLISYAYIKMLGKKGVADATKYAILNANYLKAKLEKYYPILFVGDHGRVAHEFIIDFRKFKHSVGIEVEDVAKRLMDYGFHAPTVSFPVPGTIMIEPTESEGKAELDRFAEAMISIRNEIKEIEDGKADPVDNVLKNAPHTAQVAISDNWKHTYSREKAVYPMDFVRLRKFWPSVRRVNNTHGDRNLICTCLPIEAYQEELVS